MSYISNVTIVICMYGYMSIVSKSNLFIKGYFVVVLLLKMMILEAECGYRLVFRGLILGDHSDGQNKSFLVFLWVMRTIGKSHRRKNILYDRF